MAALTNLRQRIVLHPEPGSFTAEGESARWSNKDLDPVPQENKKWEWYHVGGFWIAEGFNVAQLETPSSAVALGLNPGLAMVACLIGNLLVTLPTMSSAYLGSKYGLNFPVISRASFGMRGAYVAMVVRIFLPLCSLSRGTSHSHNLLHAHLRFPSRERGNGHIRGVVCVIWMGVQSSVGGNAVRCMVEAIWPSFKHWHVDALPASAAITAPDLLCFAIFWIAQFPFLFLSINQLRIAFMIKVVVMPFFGVVLFTWALTAAGGWGPLFSLPNNITNGWSIGGDITRYAHDSQRAWQMQLLLPVCITLTELLGTVMAASSQVIYGGEVQWNPLMVVLLWDNRTGKFFAGFLFCFANIMTNVAGNSVPFANDLMGLFPKYINIRRGQIVCAILGFAICPWLIQAKAARFLAFLNGYTVFLGPLIGLLVSDYWLVRRGKGFNVRCLYTPKNSLYWYTAGVNPRAIAALLTGITPLLPGLAHSINENLPVARGALQFYTMAWLDGLIITMVTYYLLYLAFPFSTDPDYFLNGEEDVEVADSENVSEKADEKPKGP
ncbi:hypothetical protein LTR56_015179 [Elasticomyces elasticus]|nr:hypothetical protein LTR56_015179 [Elasticomyces elasticus]KAK3644473.1 hypothetical protein LTR22_015193 [Elasticomyces elasticus]KAK4915510.1 hypothetical protein LTR49_016357 [Elasticomyces elasticus]KAK5756227.1 hypothetical protein LTS12_013651 [Elasticomyces elasticus]